MAKKFIDADLLKEEIEQNWDMQDLYLPIHFFDKVDDMLAADVQEVKHGEWIVINTEQVYNGAEIPVEWACSLCESSFEQTFAYCPHCGARMDGEEK